MKPYWHFLIFWIFLQFFCNFQLSVRLGQNETIIFIFSLSLPFPNYFGLKWCHNGIFFFIFFHIFLLFFWNFLLRVGLEWNRTAIFTFFLSRTFPTNSGFKWSHTGIFYFFEFFCNFFAILNYSSGRNETKW